MQDYREVEGRVALFEGEAGEAVGGNAEEGGQKLRKLSMGELKQSVEGHTFWTETRLLDHKVWINL